LTALLAFGPRYLTEDEFARRHKQRFFGYYRLLAKNLFRAEPAFWDMHRKRLGELGYRLEPGRLVPAVLAEVLSRSLGRWSEVPLKVLNKSVRPFKPVSRTRS
jgi:hypothetical protein